MAALLLAATGAPAQPRFESERSRDRFEEDGRFLAQEVPEFSGRIGNYCIDLPGEKLLSVFERVRAK